MGFELGFEKNNFLGNGIRTPLHDPLDGRALLCVFREYSLLYSPPLPDADTPNDSRFNFLTI